MDEGGLAGAVFNAAKERALDGFIAGEIGFLDMARVVEVTLDRMLAVGGLQNAAIDLDTILNTDAVARVRAAEAIAELG